MLRLLFTGGGGAGNEAIYRLLRDKYDLHFADADLESIDSGIPAGRRHEIPIAKAKNFLEALFQLGRKLSIDVIVPGVDEELSALCDVAARDLNCPVLMPDEDYVLTMLDKQRFADVLRSKNITVPATVPLDRAQEIGFPCFSKPRYGRGSRDTYILRNEGQSKALFAWSVSREVEFIAQKLLKGQEYTVLMAADSRQNLHAVLPVEVSLKRGITLRAHTVSNSIVEDACRRIHESFPAHGCYNIQLIQTADGTIYPFEINPRISTTFCLGVAAGIDPVEIFLSKSAPAELLPFRENLALRRRWTNRIGE